MSSIYYFSMKERKKLVTCKKEAKILTQRYAKPKNKHQQYERVPTFLLAPMASYFLKA